MKLAKGSTLWVAEQRGTSVYLRTGRVGEQGRVVAKEFSSGDLARTYLLAERQKRLDKGFQVIDEEATLSEPFTNDGKPLPGPIRPELPARYRHLEDTLHTEVLGGFRSRDDFDQVIEDLLSFEPSAPPTLRGALERIVDIHFAEMRSRPRPARCVNDAIDAAFEELGHRGVVALQSAGVTQNDGWSDANSVATERASRGDTPIGACFYHLQDLERAVAGGGLLLTYGAYVRDESTRDQKGLEVGALVLETLRKHGITVEWSGRLEDRIAIAPFEWYRRA